MVKKLTKLNLLSADIVISWKNLTVHSLQNIKPWTARLISFMTAADDFEMWITNVRNAHLQSDEPM